AFRKLPSWIRYCEPPAGFPLEQFQSRTVHRWPVVPFGGGVITFASPDPDGFLGPGVPARVIDSQKVNVFLEDGWGELKIPCYDARRHLSDLCNQAFERFLADRGLKPYAGANGRLVWWADIRTAPLSMVSFNWRHQKGRRQIIGVSGK